MEFTDHDEANMSRLFPTMFHIIKRMNDFNRALESIPDAQKNGAFPFDLVRLEEETATIISALKENIPFTSSNLEYVSKSILKVRLTHLVSQLEELRHTLDTDIQILILVPPNQLEKVKVWSFECTDIDQLPGATLRTYDYWQLVFSEVVRCSRLPRIQLKVCKLSTHLEKVTVQLEWYGPFDRIEFLTVPHVAKSFWKPILTAEESNQLSLQTTMFFLYLQTAAIWGENEFISAKVEEGKLIASLQVLRADSQSAPPLELPISETSEQDISNYVVQLFYPTYLELSQELEAKLQGELERRRTYVKQGLLESDAIEQIHRWLDDLISLREAYTIEVSSFDL